MAIKKPYKDDLFEAIDTIGEEAEINDINAVSPDEITGLIPEEQEPVAYEDKRSYTTLELFASDETAKAAANFAVARGVSPSANWLWTLAGESNIVDRIKVPSGWEWNIGGDDGFGDDIFVSPEGITYSYDELMQLGVESDDEVFLEDVAGITGQATTEQQKLIDIQTGLLELFPDMTAQESYEYYFTAEDESVQEARTEQFFETLQTAGKSDATINLLKSLFPEISNEDLSAILGEQVSDETISEDWWHSMLYGLKGLVYSVESGFFTIVKGLFEPTNEPITREQIEQGSNSLEDIAAHPPRGVGVSIPWLYKWADENIKRNEEELEEFLKEHPQWDTSYYDDPDYTDISTWTDPGFYASIIPKALPTAAALIVGASLTAVTKNPRAGLAAASAFFHPLNTQDLYEDLKDSGASDLDATQLANAIGPIITALDIIGLGAVGKLLLPTFYKTLKKNIVKEVTKDVVKSLTKKQIALSSIKVFSMIELSELVTENLQGVIQNATVKTIDESRDIFENLDHTTVQVALTMFPLAIIGGGGYYKQMQAYLPENIQATKEKLVAELVKAGLTEEAAETKVFGDIYQTPEGKEAIDEAVKQTQEAIDNGEIEKIETVQTTDIKDIDATKYENVDEFIVAVFNKTPEYGMSHRPTWEEMPPASNLLEGGMIPQDVYEHPEYSIASGRDIRTDKSARESWNVLQRVKNKPEATVTVYRATRKDELNIGDWVTFSEEYAKQSIDPNSPEKVYSFQVSAKDVIFAGDDINEFGYYPKDRLIKIWEEANTKKQASQSTETQETEDRVAELKAVPTFEDWLKLEDRYWEMADRPMTLRREHEEKYNRLVKEGKIEEDYQRLQKLNGVVAQKTTKKTTKPIKNTVRINQIYTATEGVADIGSQWLIIGSDEEGFALAHPVYNGEVAKTLTITLPIKVDLSVTTRDLTSMTRKDIKARLEGSTEPILLTDLDILTAKIGNPRAGFDLYKNASSRFVLVSKGLEEGVATDGFLLIEDKEIATKVLDGIITAEAKKDFNKAKKVDSDATLSSVKERLIEANSTGTFPDYKQLYPETLGGNLKLVGVDFVGAESGRVKTIRAFLTDGNEIMAVDANKLAFMHKYLPTAELKLAKSTKRGKVKDWTIGPVSFVVNGENKGLLMPMSLGDAVIPQAIIDNAVKQKQEAIEKVGEAKRQAEPGWGPGSPKWTELGDVMAMLQTGNLTAEQVDSICDTFGLLITSNDAKTRMDITTELRKAERAKRAANYSVRIQELIIEGKDVGTAERIARGEMLSEKLPSVDNETIKDITGDFRKALEAKVYNVLRNEGYEIASTMEALNNALAGKPIPRTPGTKGGSAYSRLVRVFGGSQGIMELLETQKPVEDIIEGVFTEYGQDPIDLDPDMIEKLRDLPNDGIQIDLFAGPTKKSVKLAVERAYQIVKKRLDARLAAKEITQGEYDVLLAAADEKYRGVDRVNNYEPELNNEINKKSIFSKKEEIMMVRTMKALGKSTLFIGKVLRALKASFDMSFGRQMAPFIIAHFSDFTTAFTKNFRAFMSEDVSASEWQAHKVREGYTLHEQYGGDVLRRREFEEGASDYQKTEEFGYNDINTLEGKLTNKVFPWINWSQRAFETGINEMTISMIEKFYHAQLKIQSDIASGKISLLKKKGKKAVSKLGIGRLMQFKGDTTNYELITVGKEYTTVADEQGNRKEVKNDTVVTEIEEKEFDIHKNMKQYLEYLANASGRGEIKNKIGKTLAPYANAMFFSLRLNLGRLVSVKHLFSTNKYVCKEAWKDFGSFIGVISSVMLLGNLAGLWDVETDPRSSDFMKIRIGNVRVDPWGGYQQFVVFFARVITDTGFVATSGMEYEANFESALTTFFKSKASPLASTLLEMKTGKDYFGNEIDLTDMEGWIERFAPLAIWDIYEAWQEGGLRGAMIGLPALVGMNIQAYTGDWEDNFSKIGGLKYPDNEAYGLDGPIYSTGDFYSATSPQFKGVDPETLTIKKGFPAYVKSVVEAKQLIDSMSEWESNEKEDYLTKNTDENALLAVWGKSDLYSMEAYYKAVKLADELDIVDNGVKWGLPSEEAFKNWFNYLDKMSIYDKDRTSSKSSLHLSVSKVTEDNVDIFYLDMEYALLRKSDGTSDTKARRLFRLFNPKFNQYGVDNGWWLSLDGDTTGLPPEILNIIG